MDGVCKGLVWEGLSDRGYIKQELFESLFCQGIQLVHGLKAKMKEQTDAYVGQIMLRKRYIIECINELLKNKPPCSLKTPLDTQLYHELVFCPYSILLL